MDGKTAAQGAAISATLTEFKVGQWRKGSTAKDDRPTLAELESVGLRVMGQRTWVATLEDGSQVLIDYWPETDTVTVALRDRSFHGWGPPVDAVESGS